MVAEIQQSSDVTYRLHDWNRTGPDGRPRPLHVDAGLEAVTKTAPVGPVRAAATPDAAVKRLVTSDYFLLEEVRPQERWTVGDDDACHFLAVLAGEVRLDERWPLPAIPRGGCVLLPAAIGPQSLRATPVDGKPPTLLHVSLP